MWSVVGYVILYFIMLLYLLYYKYVLFSNMYYVIYCKLHYITLVSPRFRDTLHPSICTVVVMEGKLVVKGNLMKWCFRGFQRDLEGLRGFKRV